MEGIPQHEAHQSPSPRWPACWPSPRPRPRRPAADARRGRDAAAPAARCSPPGRASPTTSLAADGGFEAGGLGWTLSGGAAVVPGGDPFALGGAPSAKALSLPAGSSALSAANCIAADTPTFRLLARNHGRRELQAPRRGRLRSGGQEGEPGRRRHHGRRRVGADEGAHAGAPEGRHGDECPVPLHAARRGRPLAGRRRLRGPHPAPLSRN